MDYEHKTNFMDEEEDSINNCGISDRPPHKELKLNFYFHKRRSPKTPSLTNKTKQKKTIRTSP